MDKEIYLDRFCVNNYLTIISTIVVQLFFNKVDRSEKGNITIESNLKN